MATLYTHKDSNIAKTWALMSVFFIVVIGLGWLISIVYETPLILYGAALLSVGMSIWSYWYSDRLVVRMTGAHPVTNESHPDLYNIVENLSITAGLPMPRVYVIDDPAPNAFATGRNPEHAVVAATTGLLSVLNRTELEGVLAHELSHIGNRDMLVSTVAVVLVGTISILSDIFLRMSLFGGGDNKDNRLAAIALVGGIVLASIAGPLIQLAISRKREFLADASGALLTRYPEGLASALQKISAYSQPMRRANHATAHLFISDPFGGKRRGIGNFIQKLFMTHPPVEERIQALLGDRA